MEVDPRETTELVRADAGRLIAARATASSAPTPASTRPTRAARSTAVLLPADPDASARGAARPARLRGRDRATRSAARGASARRRWRSAAPVWPRSTTVWGVWRVGQSEVAIGCAGLAPLDDWRGRPDREGRLLHSTQIAIADQAAAAADLVRGKDTATAVRIRGLERHVLPGRRAGRRRPAARRGGPIRLPSRLDS